MLNSISRLGETRPKQDGRMKRNFPGIPNFWNFRPASRGPPKFRNEIPDNDCSIRSPTRNFRNFWSNEKRPKTSDVLNT